MTSYLKRFERAWESRDSRGFARRFAPNGVLVLWTGLRLVGRQQIEARHRMISPDYTQHIDLQLDPVWVAHARRGVAVVQGDFRFVRRDGTFAIGSSSPVSIVLVRGKFGWRIQSLQFTPLLDHPG